VRVAAGVGGGRGGGDWEEKQAAGGGGGGGKDNIETNIQEEKCNHLRKFQGEGEIT